MQPGIPPHPSVSPESHPKDPGTVKPGQNFQQVGRLWPKDSKKRLAPDPTVAASHSLGFKLPPGKQDELLPTPHIQPSVAPVPNENT